MKKPYNLLLWCMLGCLLLGGCHTKEGSDKTKKFGSKQASLIELYNMADSVYYQQQRIDTALFGRFIRTAVDFAKSYPTDEIAPDMLYRAGVGSMILAKAAHTQEQTAQYAKQAIAIFHQYQEQYPSGDKAEFCYYQRGIIYDDILGDTRSAENEYRDYINRNPNDSLSRQLEHYIKLLGLSEQELEKTLNLE